MTTPRLTNVFADTCPRCGEPWDARPQLVGTPATEFDDCAFRCHGCGIAFSNATTPTNRILITRTAELNVPAPARPGLDTALRGAAAIGNRATKRKKFCSSTSEDAVTWTVVAGLQETNSLEALVGEEHGPPEAVLLWGHPVSGPDASRLAAHLLTTSDQLGEHPTYRSEPDVIVLWPDLLLFVEAKYGSSNDRKPDYRGYATYLPAPHLFAASDEAVRAEGSYQLARNWVIGTSMAEDSQRPFRLINLGPSALAEQAARFAALLRQKSDRRFQHITWQKLLESAAVPEWLDRFAEERALNAL